MKKKFIIISLASITLLLLVLSSCSQEDDLGYIDYEPRVVVEGKIEAGGYAFVMLTQTSSFNIKLDTLYLMEHVIKSAKVSVSDGEETEILTLGREPDYIPPYAYYGRKLKGVPGKKYRLEIAYQNKIISAETTIPEPAPLDDYFFLRESDTSILGHIHIRFTNDPEVNRYYQVATKVSGKEKQFTPCLFGNIDSKQLGEETSISLILNKGPMLYPTTSYETSFHPFETVFIQFKTMPKEGFLFWNSWQEEVVNTQNPIFPAHNSLQSNIDGGIGIWCGYGVNTYSLTTRSRLLK